MLDCALFAYRTTVHQIVQETPFFLLYGRDVSDIIFLKPVDYSSDGSDVDTQTQYKINQLAKL
jgi:hypothetical protein